MLQPGPHTHRRQSLGAADAMLGHMHVPIGGAVPPASWSLNILKHRYNWCCGQGTRLVWHVVATISSLLLATVTALTVDVLASALPYYSFWPPGWVGGGGSVVLLSACWKTYVCQVCSLAALVHLWARLKTSETSCVASFSNIFLSHTPAEMQQWLKLEW
jgi:hypothetical protein